MRILLFFIMLLVSSVTAIAQDTYLQSNVEEATEEKAKKLTNAYNEILVLSSKQVLLFEKKIVEFLIRKKNILDTYEGEEELKMLVINQQNETAEMGDILTRPQLDLYKQYKMELQPLKKL